MEDPKPKAKTKSAPKSAAAKNAQAEASVTAKKSTRSKAAAVPAEESAPVVKKASTKKVAAAEPAPEKPVRKRSSAAKTATESTPVAPEAAAPKAAPQKAKAKKEAEESVPLIRKADEVAAPKKPRKAKAAAKEAESVAQEAPVSTEPGKKVRTKPRRRELKRQGLWVPKQERGKHGKQMAALKAEEQASKPAIAPVTTKGKGKNALPEPPAAQAGRKGGKPDGKADKKDKAAKPVPTEFENFTKRPNTRTERKNERRMERALKEERELDQAQGHFEEPIRLNRFVALSGICSRRDADILIQEGKVKVNGKVVKEMGHKVQPGKDKVVYKDHELRIKVFVYLLMNKPKNRITTTEDELGRDTVMEIAKNYTKARVYPVGRLDRNTTGLLILTNDGDLTLKLTHPSSKFPKYYVARLDRDIADADILQLRKGFELEDGFIKADKAERVSLEAGNEIGLEIHSGANHIVKRMLAHLGYEVTALDRVKLGPLTKKGLPRGKCRMLTEREVGFLKML